ncbi:MmcQ/YjbR family DNA-binding protein [Ferrimonas lipolytica]|uniref:MmcQ/YjbR family DNA-binding protein n=1 Tax=Ferrimonas lipolytica TaxID=2724191 RepID=A0A6H1UGN3_9GAMM|nr:MmcQ/YjbR family DNA-binding protein [Ferrimonas lipolytica]QIZ76952.1 MmcQ/YjbR family DNA-binding protein [Ferrimonas lipolytica]
MKHQQCQHYLLAKPETTESNPFGPEVAVFKVANKMFATLSCKRDKQHWWMNLKCDPDEALALRDIFTAVIPGYHMNKKHWNSIILDGSIPTGEIQRMIDNSYLLVVHSLPKQAQTALLLQLKHHCSTG